MDSPHPNARPKDSLPAELRDPTLPPAARAWVRRSMGREVRTATALDGASSVAIFRLDLDDGSVLCLRRYAWSGYLDAEPDAPGREVDALVFADRHGLTVPSVVAADTTGADIGDEVPCILTTFLAGRPVAVPDLDDLARAGATIHDVDASDLGHEYFPWYEDEMTTPPPTATDPARWERAIETWRNEMPEYRPTFIHRDFHPGNLLWANGSLSGIVDWSSACRGPIGCDLAHCRSNLRNLADPLIADRFVDSYRALTGRDLHPFWIMAGHLEHSHRHWTPERIAADEPDLFRALAQL